MSAHQQHSLQYRKEKKLVIFMFIIALTGIAASLILPFVM